MSRQFQIPGGQYLNKETAAREFQIPGGVYLGDPTWPFDEAIAPDGVTLTNMAGAYTDIDEEPNTPDASWLTAT